MSNYLDFKQISWEIRFKDFLNWLNLSYKEKNGQIKGEFPDGELFVVNMEKNLFFCPAQENVKGSVINFYSHLKNCDLREAAQTLKERFLDTPKPNQRGIPELVLNFTPLLPERFGISEDISEIYEVGLVKQRSIMSGHIAFKIYNEKNEHTGYVGWHPKKNKWFFPKNFKRTLYNIHNAKQYDKVIVTVNPFDCLKLVTMNVVQVVSLLGKSMSDHQEELIREHFNSVMLLHSEPENTINRLARHCFVKAPPISKPGLKNYSVKEIVSFLG